MMNHFLKSLLWVALLLHGLLPATGLAQLVPHYDFRIVPIDVVNTPGNDYAPTLSGDHHTLWFCSYERPEGFGFSDVYRSGAPEEGRWNDPINAGEGWNQRNNEGAIAIAADNTTVVVAMDGRGGYGDTDLYIGELIGDSIANLNNLGRNVNSKYWDSQPTITGNGKIIYFASNRPGGYGGVDIWVTVKTDEGWTRAVPLDSTINTTANERSPYVIQKSTSLFFSSDRPGGFGGEDFWVSYLELGQWSKPVNLGSDINSSGDELFFHAPPGSTYFYFASNRDGEERMLDIYSGSPNIFGDGRRILDIEVVDEETGEPVQAYVTVTDVEEQNILWEFVTDALKAEVKQVIVPAGREYMVTARKSLREMASLLITDSSIGRTQVIFPKKEKEDNPLPERELVLFDLGEYNVPFFVTGYYRPNTTTSLPELLDLLGGPLAPATYIERFPRGSKRHGEYQNYATKIDSILNEMAVRIVDSIAPAFLQHASPNESMELIVTGFVDPQIFRGEYIEAPTIEFSDVNGKTHAVRKGDPIENFELSGLRAVFAQRLVEQILLKRADRGNPAFKTLLESGRVSYRTVAGGVSGGTTEYDKQRRIHVLIVRSEKEK